MEVKPMEQRFFLLARCHRGVFFPIGWQGAWPHVRSAGTAPALGCAAWAETNDDRQRSAWARHGRSDARPSSIREYSSNAAPFGSKLQATLHAHNAICLIRLND